MPNVCEVSGSLVDLGMDPVPRADFVFSPITSRVLRNGNSIVMPIPMAATTNTSGEIVVNLVPARYSVSVVADGADRVFYVTVPDATTAFLAQIIDLPPPTNPNALEQAVLDAQSARDVANEALAAAQIAASQSSEGAITSNAKASEAMAAAGTATTAAGAAGAWAGIAEEAAGSMWMFKEVMTRDEIIAQTSPLAPGYTVIPVLESGFIVWYVRDPDGLADDLIAGDLSTWWRAGFNVPDAVAIGNAIASANASMINTSGSFTPVVEFSGGGGVFTHTSQLGWWYRRGSAIRYIISLNFTVDALGTGSLQIGGFPVAALAGSIPQHLRITSKTFQMRFPFGTTDYGLRMDGGSTKAVFNYSSADMTTLVYITGIAGNPEPTQGPVTFFDSSDVAQSAKIVDFVPDAGLAGSGWVTIVGRTGGVGNGKVMTGPSAAWTGTISTSKTSYGAAANTTDLNAAFVITGKSIILTIDGEILV